MSRESGYRFYGAMKQALPHLLNPFPNYEIDHNTTHLVVIHPTKGLILLTFSDFYGQDMRLPTTITDFNPYSLAVLDSTPVILCANVEWYPNGLGGPLLCYPYLAAGSTKIEAWDKARYKLQEVVMYFMNRSKLSDTYKWIMEYYLVLLEDINLPDDKFTNDIRGFVRNLNEGKEQDGRN